MSHFEPKKSDNGKLKQIRDCERWEIDLTGEAKPLAPWATDIILANNLEVVPSYHWMKLADKRDGNIVLPNEVSAKMFKLKFAPYVSEGIGYWKSGSLIFV